MKLFAAKIVQLPTAEACYLGCRGCMFNCTYVVALSRRSFAKLQLRDSQITCADGMSNGDMLFACLKTLFALGCYF